MDFLQKAEEAIKGAFGGGDDDKKEEQKVESWDKQENAEPWKDENYGVSKKEQKEEEREGDGPPMEEVNTDHRYRSFADESAGNVKWFVDGASYFHAVSMALEQAQESIYILDWWLSPELYLRRPPAQNEQYRLDRMLKDCAERGVEIRIIVYKEVKQALTLDSAHTKHHLESLHPNIKVFRHPDHLPTNASKLEQAFEGLSLDSLKMNAFDLSQTSGDAVKELYGSFGDSVLYWAHHEKLCVIDRRLVFMGGLDMCFGRWDTNSHPIADAHPGNMDAVVFPGQDFNNARVFDFEGVDNWDQNKLNRTENSRMGWSDVALSMNGPIVGSLIEHFIDRWNFIYVDKYTKKDEGKYQRIARSNLENESQAEGEVKIQLCRSACDWSSGHPTEHSIMNAYVNAIESAEHFIYIENQFFITATSDEQEPVKNKIGGSIVRRIVRAYENNEDFKVIVVMPAVPAFAGDLKSDGALGTRAIMEFQYASISRGGHSIIEKIREKGVEDWQKYIGFFNLRNYDRINISPILGETEQESGVQYDDARREYEGMISRDTEEEGDRDQYDRYQAAARRRSDKTWDSVASCYMYNGTDIREVPWSGDEESEMKAFVSEELYIHSKLLIADDRLVICGSANLNDRSQLGTHDSEIAVVIEDPNTVESTMNGESYSASRFATSLRRQLFRKHIGLLEHQPVDAPNENWTPVTADPQAYDWGSEADRLVEDPLSEDFWRLWQDTAGTNTEAFSRAFHNVPNDHVRTWKDYKEFFSKHFVMPGEEESEEQLEEGKVRYGHVVRDEFPGGVSELKDCLSRIRGTLVFMPLDFLVDVRDMAKEGLTLNNFTEEIYT
ncbi:phospholipase [Xylariomycetidae sp. FL0641]|nr:phospholipase [Xylariomycetidae sp. FL0641]